jgi:hypothetical protein
MACQQCVGHRVELLRLLHTPIFQSSPRCVLVGLATGGRLFCMVLDAMDQAEGMQPHGDSSVDDVATLPGCLFMFAQLFSFGQVREEARWLWSQLA